MPYRFVGIVTLLLMIGAAGRAQDIDLAPGGLAVAPSASRNLEFGTVPQKDTVVTLEVTSRLDAREAAGSNFFLHLRLNGIDVLAARSRTAQRLVNKPLDSPVTPTITSSWFGNPRGWRVLYAPDFEIGRKAAFYTGDPYTLVMDVTDLINPAAENRLEVTNTADGNAIRAANTGADLVIQKLTIHARPGHSPLVFEARPQDIVLNRGEPAAGAAPYRGRLLPGGAISLVVGRREWRVSSAFSEPGGSYNAFFVGASGAASRAAGKTAAGWQPWLRGSGITATGKFYHLDRKVLFGPHRIEVADTITNSLATPLGLRVRHEASLEGLQDPPVRIAGNPDPAVNDYYSPGNPSVVVDNGDSQLGLICEDDVLRNQARLYVRPSAGQLPAVAGIRTDTLRLAPHESYTMRWSIYLVAGHDYFDFINLVRGDWQANYPVDGAWYWGFVPESILAMTDADLAAKFKRLGVRYTTIGGGWVDRQSDPKRIGFGTGVMEPYWAAYRERVRAAAIKLRRAVPGIKVLAYYDTQRDTRADALQLYPDSILTGPDGKPEFTDWSGVYSRSFSMVPTLGNSYGKGMLDTADRYVSEVGLDGIYWDELENTLFGAPLVSYAQVDGHSCDLDPATLTIKREFGTSALLSDAFRQAVVKRMHDQGKVVLGNGPAGTRGMLATGAMRMIEAQHNDSWPAEGYLGTPLGYLSGQMQWKDCLRVLNLGLLPVGTRLDYQYDITRYLFPFTPRELHSGYLLGQERIVVTHSGNYGWTDRPWLCRARYFDSGGKLVASEAVTLVGSEARTKLTLGKDEAAVLERLPLALENAGPAVGVSQLKYGATAIGLSVDGAMRGTLQVEDGEFPIRAGAFYEVRIGDGVERLKAGATLRIPLKTAGATEISLRKAA